MPVDIRERAEIFRALHLREKAFVLPNPWDAGSAKMLTALGFSALATTSAGFAFSSGKGTSIGEISREEALEHAAGIIAATTLPVSADLENGYGHTPEEVAETVRLAAEIGLAGCTIEDTTGDPDNPIYERAQAIDRIAAAAEVVRGLDRPFMLTARAENYLFNRPDFGDTLMRLQCFEMVGADVLYAPALPDLQAIKTVCKEVSKPLNVVAGIGLPGVTITELEAAGVKRISVGSAFARVAYGAMIDAAEGIIKTGSFAPFMAAASFSSIETLIKFVNLKQ
ncbi:isocitrate lyase/PEP mutase family protein [Sneathiella sp. HT1-7]|uniref:isocitrate lyase/PEP mutase family protein n=1 Tax=Sneathiella sp. HT1-7 TaxID=2887192 RepID=UPI001D1552BA|nr:isocitrate lyase/phosphoenolpyruvate mutase family protein [Sneathiella sp. HT1-7]MCC3306552.1 isocitrate lyase/phosphoenolpyruvate mutase family protein [Sneathiella sp. HT1-7]